MGTELFAPGTVVIAAAGPGDVDLITVKATLFLAEADVILVDRLVNPEIVQRYAKKDAHIIEVGKQAGKTGSSPQGSINEALVAHALQGLRVLRLKGGDISIFSNILDELEALTEAGIAFQLVPGVTSALGAAAYAGIPLTARGFARGVRLLTILDPMDIFPGQWKEWAATDDTLVFYMSGRTLTSLAENLVSNGMPSSKPLAIISQATTPGQQVQVASIGQFLETDSDHAFVSPTLIIVGEVVRLHERFQWFQHEENPTGFFPPVANLAGTQS
jgi:uroporphyrin-III C-methyltransferase